MYEDNNNDDTKQQIIRPQAYFMYEEILLSKFPFIKIDHVCYEKAYFFPQEVKSLNLEFMNDLKSTLFVNAPYGISEKCKEIMAACSAFGLW